MKKVSVKTAVKKFIAVTAAALMLGSGMAFVSCSSDDEEEGTASVINPDNPSQPETPVNPNPSTVEFTAQKTTVSVENLGESATGAKSADESIATVEVTDGALSITSVKAGETTVTASKGGYGDASVKVTVAADGSVTTEVTAKFKQRAADAVVTGIAVESNTNEFEFGAAEPDWKTILTVRKVYSDESTESVSDGFTVTGWNSSEAGEKELTVTCDGKTATFKVTIAAPLVLTSIEVSPAAVEIEEDATEADLRAKLTVNAVMSNDSKRVVTDYTISGFYGSKAGEQAVKVSYNEKEAVVTVKVMPWFTSLKFDSAFDGTTEKDYAKADADFVSEDGTWTILHGVKSSAAKVSKNAAKSYNEDETYTSRIQMKLEVLKLKVGKNKEVILRVDGGSASGSGNNRTLTAKGSTTATWTSFKGSADGKVCAGFLTVTGDANGYVTLSADNNINIYGIKVVDSAEDLSSTVLGKSIEYSDAKVELSAEKVNQNGSITASAIINTKATPLYANGLAGDAEEPESVDTFNFYIVTAGEDNKEILTPVESLPTNEIGEHTVKAVFYTESQNEAGETVKTENSKFTAKATYTVVDPNAAKYTVTFEAGENGSFAENTVTSVDVEENGKLAESEIPTPTANTGFKFKGWKSSEDGVTTESEITKAVTFTAEYVQLFTVTFEAGDGTFAEGATTSFIVEDGEILDSTKLPKAIANDTNNRFKEWTSSVAGLTTGSAITQNVTFTASYEVKPAAKTYIFTASDIKTVSSASPSDATVNKDGLDFIYNNASYKEEDYAESDEATAKASSKLGYMKMGGKYQSGKNYIAFKVPANTSVKVTAILFGAKNANLAAGIYTEPNAEKALASNANVTTKTVDITTTDSKGVEKITKYGVPVTAEYTFDSDKEQTVYLGYLGGTGHFVSLTVEM